jgi:predicted nucleic acid-binding protein
MKTLVDTNILISALLFPRSKPAKALLYTAKHHDMVLCDRNLYELRDVLKRKAPNSLPDAEVLLAELSYELIPAAYNAQNSYEMLKTSPSLMPPLLPM